MVKPNSPQSGNSPGGVGIGGAPGTTSTGTAITGNSTQQILGMIVDRSSFDEGTDFHPTNGNNGGELQETAPVEGGAVGGNGVVMKNGKVRRRLRWKPPAFRKKKHVVSSNASVISALTNKSNSTNKTFLSGLSGFSRKSTKSFHTFHSTATPVVTNQRGAKTTTQYPLPRPNYPDTFEGKQSTIDSEGKILHRRMGSLDRSIPFNVNEVDMERCTTLTSRLDSMPISPTSISSPTNNNSNSRRPFHPNGTSSNQSILSDPFDNLEDPLSPKSNKTKASIPRPPKTIKRRMMKNRRSWGAKIGVGNASDATKPVSPTTQKDNLDNVAVEPENTAPTIASTASRPSLSASISLERENSVLPSLAADDFEEDRRVSLCIGTPARTNVDFEETADRHAENDGSVPNISRNSSRASNAPSMPPSNDSGRQPPSPPRRTYHRPVDSTSTSQVGMDSAVSSDDILNDLDQSTINRSRQKAPLTGAATGDVDKEVFLEAEHNLRAIHDMAAEHLAHGEFAEAVEVFEEILRGQQERYGHNHYRVGTALHNLGIVHLKSGDYDKAIEICSQAVKVRRESLVPDHPDVAVSLAQLGVAHLECRQYEQALMSFREALHIRQTYLGPKHPKCSKILNNIGCALYSLDELEGSRLAFQEALDIQRETLRTMPQAAESPKQEGFSNSQSNQVLLSVASTLCNLASIRLQWGQFDDAGVALEEALLVRALLLFHRELQVRTMPPSSIVRLTYFFCFFFLCEPSNGQRSNNLCLETTIR